MSVILLLLGYLAMLAGGLGLPALVVWQRDPVDWLDLAAYGGAVTLLVAAAFFGALVLARLFFPFYWWMAQVQHKDVFEYDGVYFIGLRITRLSSRLQRAVFGVDERMRRWDLIFGLIVVVLLVPQFTGLVAAQRFYDRVLPNPARVSETLHATVLSSLPVMQELGRPWKPDPALYKRVDRNLQLLRMQPRKTNEQRFQLAQYYLLKAFVPRDKATDPFFVSPGERLYFERSQGAQAVVYLNQMLEQPELERAGWSGGALALIGFFHLADRNYPEAYGFFERALAELGQGDESGISRYEVLLLDAQAAMLSGREHEAISRLETILVDDRMPNQAYALALEHYAEALRLMGEDRQVTDLLSKAQDLYKVEKDKAGLARIQLRLAAMAIDEGKYHEAAEALSTASSMATGVSDGFTLNMVERLSLAIPG